MLRLVPDVYALLISILRSVLLVTGLQLTESGPLLDELCYRVCAPIVSQHFQQVRGHGFDSRLVLDKTLHAGRKVAIHQLHEFFPSSFVKLANDGDVLNLFFRELAMRAIDLSKDVSRIDEKNAVVGLGAIEEPERCRQRDGVEHVRWQR